MDNRSIYERRESTPITNIVTNSSGVVGGVSGGGGGGVASAVKKQSSIVISKGRRASMFDPIDPTELQKTLYQNEVISRENSTSIDYGESVGTIEFGIEYSNELGKLTVDIIRAFDLIPKDFSGTADPYCKCTLLPDKLSQQTKVARKTLNPIFEETFEFDLEPSQLENRLLEIAIFDYDKFSRDECVGYTRVVLNSLNLETKKNLSKDLKPPLKLPEQDDLGDIMFSLGYLPGAERLTVVVMKAKNLRGLGTGKKTPPDPLVKVSIESKDGKKFKKKKTSTQKYTMNPVYNEEIVFTNITKEQLHEYNIKISVFHDSITSRELLGTIMLGSSSKGDEYEHWKDMIDGKKSIAWWHQLKYHPYTHKNSITNVLAHYNYFHHSHHNNQQQQQQQQQTAVSSPTIQQQSSNNTQNNSNTNTNSTNSPNNSNQFATDNSEAFDELYELNVKTSQISIDSTSSPTKGVTTPQKTSSQNVNNSTTSTNNNTPPPVPTSTQQFQLPTLPPTPQ